MAGYRRGKTYQAYRQTYGGSKLHSEWHDRLDRGYAALVQRGHRAMVDGIMEWHFLGCSAHGVYMRKGRVEEFFWHGKELL